MASSTKRGVGLDLTIKIISFLGKTVAPHIFTV